MCSYVTPLPHHFTYFGLLLLGQFPWLAGYLFSYSKLGSRAKSVGATVSCFSSWYPRSPKFRHHLQRRFPWARMILESMSKRRRIHNAREIITAREPPTTSKKKTKWPITYITFHHKKPHWTLTSSLLEGGREGEEDKYEWVVRIHHGSFYFRPLT